MKKHFNNKTSINKWITHLFFPLMLCVQAIVFAQDTTETPSTKKYALLFSLSNNGQIKDEITNFYAAFNISSELSSVESNALTYNLFYTYQLNLNYNIGLKLAYTKRSETTTIAEIIAQNDETKINQTIFGTSFFIRRKINLHPYLILNSGVEIPLFLVGNFTSKSINDNDFFTKQETFKKDGGIVVGLNNITSLTLLISKTFSFNLNASFGLLYYNLGDELELNSITFNKSTNEVQNVQQKEDKKKLKKIELSNAELFFGIGIHF
ncbi:MAG: hypothetical protein CVT95_02125 [Bacteroidetes bacterium HGW-Bacteroidetes-12]|nr:MAG: hypothetical protein CVT95_02125 [Bacteroidetes bacterium HGW-Bacteroidetes-12]